LTWHMLALGKSKKTSERAEVRGCTYLGRRWPS
jgi:hypothetical protein